MTHDRGELPPSKTGMWIGWAAAAVFFFLWIAAWERREVPAKPATVSYPVCAGEERDLEIDASRKELRIPLQPECWSKWYVLPRDWNRSLWWSRPEHAPFANGKAFYEYQEDNGRIRARGFGTLVLGRAPTQTSSSNSAPPPQPADQTPGERTPSRSESPRGKESPGEIIRQIVDPPKKPGGGG